ncbi:ribosyldihydronicotinamide dehydrogenase [quinone]-like isoform X2 [Mercenaria mercenaria]|uniref:ribosyldihydronicotinamide dehydrogenase [quinone]-like isoform X2 n=1 Tax=Mercenaria mercenaria TaxID=6596 RepID=UPI001E1D3814|nr:ribosyldihydronicotinamide dehydrogenase [quinone]-like isoform X2 [Mercenaria mercenaria]
MEDKKNVLIVYAHQEPKSFNGALKDTAVEVLRGQGHKVTVSDLYEMRFDPTASKHTFKERSDKEHFKFQQELSHAAENGTLPDDIRIEIDKMLAADLIILQFPMYWLGMPAILKGWIDRCFAEKVVFDTMSLKWFDNGPFINKKIMLSFTAGGTEDFFSNSGIFGDMDVILWPIQNMLRFTGFQVLAPQISHAPADVSENQRTCMLQMWSDRLQTIWKEEPLSFVHVKHFDPEKGFKLSEKYLSKLKDGDSGPNPGQNLGRSFRQGSMTKVAGISKKHSNL